jgi:hypothetical protein
MIIDFNEERLSRSPHLSGKAQCFDCRHEWHATSPVGTYILECPNCGHMRGAYFAHVECPEPQVWSCNCGCQYFWVGKEGFYCPMCGNGTAYEDIS